VKGPQWSRKCRYRHSSDATKVPFLKDLGPTPPMPPRATMKVSWCLRNLSNGHGNKSQHIIMWKQWMWNKKQLANSKVAPTNTCTPKASSTWLLKSQAGFPHVSTNLHMCFNITFIWAMNSDPHCRSQKRHIYVYMYQPSQPPLPPLWWGYVGVCAGMWGVCGMYLGRYICMYEWIHTCIWR